MGVTIGRAVLARRINQRRLENDYELFVEPLLISGIAERPTGEETIPPNEHNETIQCDSWS
jgi:hypothetical protein